MQNDIIKKEIKLLIFSSPLKIATEISSPDGILAEIVPPSMAFDCDIGVERGYEIIVTVLGSGITTGILANYIYDKIKKNGDNEAMIGGNKITGNNITVTQIINYIENDKCT